ncbi:MAG: glycosyltransferase family A protein [Pseudomonadota bacterium]
MKAFVVIATKGRPTETRILIERLEAQTRQPDGIFVVGAGEDDIGEARKAKTTVKTTLDISDEPGLPKQRNKGIDLLKDAGAFDGGGDDAFVVFYDDDFRPADDWLKMAEQKFIEDSHIVGLTGAVLADGVTGFGLSEVDADQFLSGERLPEKHWASGDKERDMVSAYGCNMAFRGNVFEKCRFDETLPLYAWQEDRDFTGQVRHLGRVILLPSAKGVHMGVKGGRQSGLKFGYSQIANPVYLSGKGTMTEQQKWLFLGKAILANMGYSVFRSAYADYPGRLRGNLIAIRDLFAGTCTPLKILSL